MLIIAEGEQMTRERIKTLLDMVIDCNQKLMRAGAITVSLEVAAYHTDLNIFYHDDSKSPEPGVSMYGYTQTVASNVVDGIRTVYDPDLKKAEDHIRRLIDDVDR